ncbi:cyclic di-GMP phosphodiesterase [Mixta tenebrionis]|uniref:cyclic-guanylate-specific phosphodiesterase n=1 Tax=Mixta tenebrionis TaxID=2562439 RepID=A0A506VB90_9GAMM|nr:MULTISPECIES: cyclic di-GMP phosphodiesterase [Mixta]QHM74886.1 Putative cyclic-di-GMP phosphodiesterase AdrB [Mixta theicola]TPW42808.1 cyclic di-GMP phosphodiesterase [Mixta tenebrionis]
MPLTKVIKRHAAYPRRIAGFSAAAGLVFFLLFSAVTLFIIQQKRAEQHDRLADASKRYLQKTFGTLEKKLLPLLPYNNDSCEGISNDLGARAAFTNGIRTILLVRRGDIWCSSATGALRIPVSNISPSLAYSRSRDIRLVAGTPMVPDRPTFLLWLSRPDVPDEGIVTTLDLNIAPLLLLAARQEGITGQALAVGDTALRLWNNQLLARSQLPAESLRQFSLPAYGLTFYLYGEELPTRDIVLTLLAGLLLAMLAASGCWLFFLLRYRPGKEISQAIKRNEFYVVYQPLIEARTGRVCGVEALLRWTHPVTGPIPPDAFISYAESQNMIVPLTRHLFALVARDAWLLRRYLPPGATMGINIAPAHLTDNGFRQDVTEWLAAMPQDHFACVFEITERTMVSEQNAAEIFDWLHARQITIAIDDFGTGHSNLIYLEKFCFDYLKIDRGFVQSIGRETITSPVLDAVLNLARKLQLKTVAEGVETGEQAAWLLKRGVTHFQGYLFSRPLPPNELICYLQTRQAALS